MSQHKMKEDISFSHIPISAVFFTRASDAGLTFIFNGSYNKNFDQRFEAIVLAAYSHWQLPFVTSSHHLLQHWEILLLEKEAHCPL